MSCVSKDDYQSYKPKTAGNVFLDCTDGAMGCPPCALIYRQRVVPTSMVAAVQNETEVIYSGTETPPAGYDPGTAGYPPAVAGK